MAKLLKHLFCTMMADQKDLDRTMFESRANVKHEYDAAVRSWVLKNGDKIEAALSNALDAILAASTVASGGTAAPVTAALAYGSKQWFMRKGVAVVSTLGASVLVSVAQNSVNEEMLADLFMDCDELIDKFGGLTTSSAMEYAATGAAAAAGAEGNAGVVFLMKKIGEASTSALQEYLQDDPRRDRHCREKIAKALRSKEWTNSRPVTYGSSEHTVRKAASNVNYYRGAGLIGNQVYGQRYNENGPLGEACNLYIDSWNEATPVPGPLPPGDPRATGDENDLVYVVALEISSVAGYMEPRAEASVDNAKNSRVLDEVPQSLWSFS
jgi:hypothetical protein